MKKIVFGLTLLLLPVIVFGITCDYETDKQTTNNRSLTCNNTKRVSTKFETKEEVEVLKNSICTIKCSEELVFSIDPVKKVLSGTSFNYPLYASGVRKCTATYNYQEYETKIRRLTEEYQSLTGHLKTTKGNEITNYYLERKACDNFTKKDTDEFNKYSFDGNALLKLETSKEEINIPYSFIEVGDYTNTVTENTAGYNACKFNENTKTCTDKDETLESWEETAYLFGKYTMPNTYLEKYTGEVKTVYTNNTCDAGDRYFIDFKEISKPGKNDTSNTGYKLSLIASNLGDNLLNKNRGNWNLNVECSYKVKNLIFPQQSSTGECKDDKCDQYGTSAFQYRIIDLNDPFPGRNPGANWSKDDVDKIIYSTKNRLSSMQKFVITLNRSSIFKTREYNDNYPYDTFNLNEMEKSKFIIANPQIIDRK